MDEPVEIVNASYQRIGSTFVVIFTINGEKQASLVVPECNPVDLISCMFKAIQITADPIGECVNEIPV